MTINHNGPERRRNVTSGGCQTAGRSATARRAIAGAALLAVLADAPCAGAVTATTPGGGASYLATLHRHTTLSTTVPGNGDQNPYGVVVAPLSSGRIRQGDVLVSNFNDRRNLQGLGTTIVDYRPSTDTLTTIARLPRALPAGGPSCPGGVGLTTALAMLSNGDVVVGALPSNDGTTATKGPGCLLVLGSDGALVGTIAGPEIDGPWGNMALAEHGGGGALFVSNTAFGVGAPDGTPPVVPKATLLRLDLAYGPGTHPRVLNRTVVADGFGEQADKGVFIIGPTGLALDPSGTLYASDALGNRIVAIPDALTRTTSAGTGRVVTKDGLLNRPLALVETAGHHLLATNGLNGQIVEVDAPSGAQIGAQWIDTDRAQTPPGSGDLFGLALRPEGGFYYVEDDMNTLLLAH